MLRTEHQRPGGEKMVQAMLHGPVHHTVTSSSHRQKQTQVPMQLKNLKSRNGMSPNNFSLTCQQSVFSIPHPLHLPRCAPKPTERGQSANPITQVSLTALQQDRINPTNLHQSRAIAVNVNHSYISYLHN